MSMANTLVNPIISHLTSCSHLSSCPLACTCDTPVLLYISPLYLTYLKFKGFPLHLGFKICIYLLVLLSFNPSLLLQQNLLHNMTDERDAATFFFIEFFCLSLTQLVPFNYSIHSLNIIPQREFLTKYFHSTPQHSCFSSFHFI